MEVLQSSGWHLTAEGCALCSDDGKLSGKAITQNALNHDLKKIGEKFLATELTKSNYTLFQGLAVLQIQKIQNVSVPKDEQYTERRSGPTTLKLLLTDGHTSFSALELQPVNDLRLSTKPGSKVLLSGEVQIKNNIMCLTNDNCKVLGGHVEKLVEQWEFKKKFSSLKQTRSTSAAPPWFPFGQSAPKQHSQPVNDNFRALQTTATKDSTEDGEFEQQRRVNIAEALAGSTVANATVGLRGSSGSSGGSNTGRATQQADAVVSSRQSVAQSASRSKSGVSGGAGDSSFVNSTTTDPPPPSAASDRRGRAGDAGRPDRGPERSERPGRGGGGGGGGRRGNRDAVGEMEDYSPPSRPSGPVTLFDFLDTKILKGGGSEDASSAGRGTQKGTKEGTKDSSGSGKGYSKVSETDSTKSRIPYEDRDRDRRRGGGPPAGKRQSDDSRLQQGLRYGGTGQRGDSGRLARGRDREGVRGPPAPQSNSTSTAQQQDSSNPVGARSDLPPRFRKRPQDMYGSNQSQQQQSSQGPQGGASGTVPYSGRASGRYGAGGNASMANGRPGRDDWVNDPPSWSQHQQPRYNQQQSQYPSRQQGQYAQPPHAQQQPQSRQWRQQNGSSRGHNVGSEPLHNPVQSTYGGGHSGQNPMSAPVTSLPRGAFPTYPQPAPHRAMHASYPPPSHHHHHQTAAPPPQSIAYAVQLASPLMHEPTAAVNVSGPVTVNCAPAHAHSAYMYDPGAVKVLSDEDYGFIYSPPGAVDGAYLSQGAAGAQGHFVGQDFSSISHDVAINTAEYLQQQTNSYIITDGVMVSAASATGASKSDASDDTANAGDAETTRVPSASKGKAQAAKTVRQQTQWKVGDFCMAKYHPEDKFYKAVISGVSAEAPSVLVTFLEYGDSYEVYLADIKPLPKECWAKPGATTASGSSEGTETAASAVNQQPSSSSTKQAIVVDATSALSSMSLSSSGGGSQPGGRNVATVSVAVTSQESTSQALLRPTAAPFVSSQHSSTSLSRSKSLQGTAPVAVTMTTNQLIAPTRSAQVSSATLPLAYAPAPTSINMLPQTNPPLPHNNTLPNTMPSPLPVVPPFPGEYVLEQAVLDYRQPPAPIDPNHMMAKKSMNRLPSGSYQKSSSGLSLNASSSSEAQSSRT